MAAACSMSWDPGVHERNNNICARMELPGSRPFLLRWCVWWRVSGRRGVLAIFYMPLWGPSWRPTGAWPRPGRKKHGVKVGSSCGGGKYTLCATAGPMRADNLVLTVARRDIEAGTSGGPQRSNSGPQHPTGRTQELHKGAEQDGRRRSPSILGAAMRMDFGPYFLVFIYFRMRLWPCTL